MQQMLPRQLCLNLQIIESFINHLIEKYNYHVPWNPNHKISLELWLSEIVSVATDTMVIMLRLRTTCSDKWYQRQDIFKMEADCDAPVCWLAMSSQSTAHLGFDILRGFSGRVWFPAGRSAFTTRVATEISVVPLVWLSESLVLPGSEGKVT